MVSVKVYAIALYVDELGAAQALRGGVNTPQPTENIDGIADALMHGNFTKVLCFQLVRDVTGKQFIGALEESLRPRLQGQCSPEVDRLKSTFLHTSLRKNGFFVMSVRGTGSISFSICDAVDADHAEPALTLNNALFARAVLDIYLGRQPLVPDARRKWAMAAAPLLSSQ